MRKTLAFSLSSALVALVCSAPRSAFAQDPPSDPLPPLPAADGDPAPPPVRATTKTDTSIVTAGVVRTNHVDTVVVAEPGSQVTVHRDAPGHHDYAPDGGRKAALIASPIVLGLGAAVFGIAYLTARGQSNCTYDNTYNSGTGQYVGSENCTSGDTVPPLVMYDVIVGAVPSAPRWVVGDVGGALLYTGARGASLVVASVVDWGNGSNNWIGPFTLGFLVPMTLAIVDLATTPHREDMVPTKPSPDEGHLLRPRITGLSPVALTDAEHRVNGGVLNLTASF
jgi:hypothetical protein